ncbi:hypothetical protein Pcinc_037122 [Petrolisthes cinctipes]|uniref:Uncharacterized protein n=1 Tax=Petrolisthes cinctipes TaxID=88211 RepID=A0AAE1BU66_PETCI|nr:hypothetical protein Pcinc_037122 [Petrolisthes cinctipes]
MHAMWEKYEMNEHDESGRRGKEKQQQQQQPFDPMPTGAPEKIARVIAGIPTHASMSVSSPSEGREGGREDGQVSKKVKEASRGGYAPSTSSHSEAAATNPATSLPPCLLLSDLNLCRHSLVHPPPIQPQRRQQ